MYGTFKHQLSKRARFLLRNRDVDLLNRLRIVKSPAIGRAAMKYLVRERLVDEGSEPYFQVGNLSISFQPDYKINDPQRLLAGISQVLVETFFFQELFNSQVNIGEGDVVLDLGANIGTTALLFSRMVGEAGHVYAFEPVVPDLCRNNVERNGMRNVTVIPKGVSNRAENIEFEFSDFCLDSKLCGHETAAAEGSRRCAVPVVRLDDWMTDENLQRLDFIKIDIEGAEEPALRGGQRLIERFKPKLSISSYHVDSVSELQHPKLVKLLREWGYQIEELGKQHIFAW